MNNYQPNRAEILELKPHVLDTTSPKHEDSIYKMIDYNAAGFIDLCVENKFLQEPIFLKKALDQLVTQLERMTCYTIYFVGDFNKGKYDELIKPYIQDIEGKTLYNDLKQRFQKTEPAAFVKLLTLRANTSHKLDVEDINSLLDDRVHVPVSRNAPIEKRYHAFVKNAKDTIILLDAILKNNKDNVDLLPQENTQQALAFFILKDFECLLQKEPIEKHEFVEKFSQQNIQNGLDLSYSLFLENVKVGKHRVDSLLMQLNEDIETLIEHYNDLYEIELKTPTYQEKAWHNLVNPKSRTVSDHVVHQKMQKKPIGIMKTQY